jgi:hypothetical protein
MGNAHELSTVAHAGNRTSTCWLDRTETANAHGTPRASRFFLFILLREGLMGTCVQVCLLT